MAARGTDPAYPASSQMRGLTVRQLAALEFMKAIVADPTVFSSPTDTAAAAEEYADAYVARFFEEEES